MRDSGAATGGVLDLNAVRTPGRSEEFARWDRG